MVEFALTVYNLQVRKATCARSHVLCLNKNLQ